MPIPKLPYPKLGAGGLGSRREVDAREVMANFRELARLVNGNLGWENMRRAGVGGIPNSMVEKPRSSFEMFFDLTNKSASQVDTNPTPLFTAPYDLHLLGVAISSCSYPKGADVAFSGELKNAANGDVFISLAAAGRSRGGKSSSFINRTVKKPLIAAGVTVSFNNIAGWVEGLTLLLSADHLA